MFTDWLDESIGVYKNPIYIRNQGVSWVGEHILRVVMGHKLKPFKRIKRSYYFKRSI